jgi:plasmid stabilization system protein ParE
MARRNKPSKPVIISPQAKADINNILTYLSQNWNQEVINEFLQKLERFYYVISINPHLLAIIINTKIYASMPSLTKT